MNREIVIGFLNEHDKNCPYLTVSNCIKIKKDCAFCSYLNRDISILITKFQGARKTVDVGIALSPTSKHTLYEPYECAGFEVFYQKGHTETQRIKSIFQESISRGYDTVILISHNVPNLPLKYVEDALTDMRNGSSLVLGPSNNGMFYLIGMKKNLWEQSLQSDMFNRLSFSHPIHRNSIMKLFQDSCESCAVLPNWYIVKSLEDLRKLHQDSVHGIGCKARWTQLIVQDLLD